MRERGAVEILRDIVASDGNISVELFDEARTFIRERDEREAKFIQRERADAAARKRRADRAKQRLGKYEIAPRHEGGTDYSGDGLVLIRNASGHRLVWRFGRKYWSARSMAYAPAELQILIGGRTSERVNGSDKGPKRLCPALLRHCSAHIDLSFGLGATERIIAALKTRETVIA